jgi:hypothetical protein
MGVKLFPPTQFVPERSTYQYRAALAAPDGLPAEPAQITSVLLSLRDVASGSIVNSRDGIEAKDANGGTVVLGFFLFQFVSEDMPILGGAAEERRILTLDFHLLGGGRATHEVWFYVRNLRDITS